MKVLFLVKRVKGIGGVEKHVHEVVKRLMKRGHKVTVISELYASESSSPIPRPRSSPFGSPSEMSPWLTIPVGKSEKLKKFKIWWWLWQNRSLINESDIIHAHDVAFWYFPFRFLYPRKPFFVTFHGWEGKFPVPWKNKLIRKISEKLSRGNICVGESIGKWYGTEPDYVIYGAINLKSQNSKLKTTTKNLKLFVFTCNHCQKLIIPKATKTWIMGKKRKVLTA